MGDRIIRKVEAGAERLSKKAAKSGRTSFGSKVENLGKLELQIKYKGDVLEVFLGQAKGLPSKDLVGSSDPYAKVYLMQSNPSALFVKGHEQTKTHNNNPNPTFNETFMFQGIDKATLFNSKLVISIWDKDMIGKDEYMCGIRVSMDHFAYDGKGHLSIQFWADLQPHFTDGHPLEVSHATVTQFFNQQGTTSMKRASVSSSSSSSSSPAIKERTKSVLERLAASVTFTVSFDPTGFLKIFLTRAQGLPDKDLIGKSDPYAKIYLLDDAGTAFIDHEKKKKTKTKKNTQNPDFFESFEFKMNLQLIRNLKTIIEIWDDDFGKDEFLAGVAFTMSSFNLSTEVEITVPLYSGRTHGLPFEVKDIMTYAIKKTSRDIPYHLSKQSGKVWLSGNSSQRFSQVSHVTTSHVKHVQKPRSRSSSSSSSSSSDDDDKDGRNSLRHNNNKLVSYIEKARIMAQAYGIGQSIPDGINLEENVNSKQSNDFEFNSQFHDLLLPAITQAKEKVRLARDELESLRGKNRRMNQEYEELTLALTNKDRSIWNLENELMALQGKCTMIQHEVTRMKELELSLDQEREYYLEQMNEARHTMKSIDVKEYQKDIDLKRASMQASFQVETEEEIEKRVSEVQLPINVYSQFKERMLKELEAKRKTYIKSVGKLHIESKQILAMYDNIVMAKEKGSLEAHRRTSMMEKIGYYRSDISGVEGEVSKLRLELERLQVEHDHKQSEFELQLRSKHEEFESFRRRFELDLQSWFARYGADFNAWCKEQIEIAIYGKLIEFEEQRLASSMFGKQSLARVSTSKRRSTYNSGPVYKRESNTKVYYDPEPEGAHNSIRHSSTYNSSTVGGSATSTRYSSSYSTKTRNQVTTAQEQRHQGTRPQMAL
ncbi:uncharacterized protein LOC111698140 isoform X3 [Eurytemora carolleeae]|uniref:uncharacterized protein LOC111698140 isoform X3 n=1 Tax=Eurytemora carolleeae TaxID=1294199 RepID=UPI000C767C2D|nr:uncharacterized protein LOC111698140 isoform X3 [Eurytemora carolleeae]|eukprot:XP_023324162.1 uncharacterized protein LOC111698140 isoform X3 [Eurytemora affinis]